MRQPFKHVWGLVKQGFPVKIFLLTLVFSQNVLLGQAILINPDFFSEEIVIRDTLTPTESGVKTFPTRLSALESLNDPLLIDSLPDFRTWLYRSGLHSKFPVLLIDGKDHWRVIELRDFEGYGLPKIFGIKQSKSGLVMVEATLRERFFTSEESPSGYQAEKSLIQLVDVHSGRTHLKQVGNLKIEQGRWSKGPEGNVASSFEQSMELSFRKQLMLLMISIQKKKYATATGTEVKSQRVSLEYKFQKGVWIRSKAAIMSY